ncbi:unnamed protein product [Ilex paraguariensis]|uniref:Uncharacterized protein n=1 Tax=Ilex paraguariensis TaxID=185542 RepID=A0ABC8QUE7_9AQUA
MMNSIHKLTSVIRKTPLNLTATANLRLFSTKSTTIKKSGGGVDEWNDAWETAWLPEDLSAKNRASWETDVNFALSDITNSASESLVLPIDADAETKAFVEDMNDNWDQRRNKGTKSQQEQNEMVKKDGNSSLYSLENVKRDYRVKKQRIHAGLWMKEIEKQEEAKFGDSVIGNGGDDIDKLLDSCSEIFDSANNYLNDAKISSSSELKSKPDGWETTSKSQDGNVWEMSQREEDILLQEFERRIAFSKFQT